MITQQPKQHGVTKILVPTDFSRSSDAALDYASFLAHSFGASIDVLYVWNLQTNGADRGRRIHFFDDSTARRSMQRALSTRANQSVRLRGRVEFGKLTPTIVEVAKADGFDLIVMGMHEHVVGRHIFNEHLARKVARHAACPVLTVRDPPPPEELVAEGDPALERWLDDGGMSLDIAQSATAR